MNSDDQEKTWMEELGVQPLEDFNFDGMGWRTGPSDDMDTPPAGTPYMGSPELDIEFEPPASANISFCDPIENPEVQPLETTQMSPCTPQNLSPDNPRRRLKGTPLASPIAIITNTISLITIKKCRTRLFDDDDKPKDNSGKRKLKDEVKTKPKKRVRFLDEETENDAPQSE